MSANVVRRVTALVALLPAVACSSIDPIERGPTTVTLTADRPAAATGEDIEFSFSGTGSSINALQLDYGDGASERVEAFGATTMSGRRTHAYTEPGSYTVTATLEDAFTGNVSDDLTVQINTPAGSPGRP